MRYFNTAGPIMPQDHYYADRIDQAELYRLLEQKKYFILHAPRQSGKTIVMTLLPKMLLSMQKKC
jgi:hypothetical protein